jgi:hypothetical protein
MTLPGTGARLHIRYQAETSTDRAIMQKTSPQRFDALVTWYEVEARRDC